MWKVKTRHFTFDVWQFPIQMQPAFVELWEAQPQVLYISEETLCYTSCLLCVDRHGNAACTVSYRCSAVESFASLLNVETFKREYPPPFFWLFGTLVRCSAHECSSLRLRYYSLMTLAIILSTLGRSHILDVSYYIFSLSFYIHTHLTLHSLAQYYSKYKPNLLSAH